MAVEGKKKRDVWLRDHFAMSAMQGLLAADGLSGIREKVDPINGRAGPRWIEPESVAEVAYELADAMLKARES